MSSPTPPDKNRQKELSNEVRMLIAFALMGADSCRDTLGLPEAWHRAAAARCENTGRQKTTATRPSNRRNSRRRAHQSFGSSARPKTSRLPNLSPAAVSAAGEQDTGNRHRSLSRRLLQSRRYRQKLDSEEVQRQRRQAARTGEPERRRKGRLPVRIRLPRQAAQHGSQQSAVGRPSCRRRPHHQLRILRRPHSRHQDLRPAARRLHGAVLRRSHAERRGPPASGRNGAAVSATWPCRTPPDNKPPSTTTLEKNKLERDAAKIGEERPCRTPMESFSFAGIDDQYFAAAFLPPPNTTLQTTTYDDTVASPGQYRRGSLSRRCGRRRRAQSVRNLTSARRRSPLLHQVNPKLDGIVDWGWFGIIAKPLFLVLHFLNDQLRSQLRLVDHSAHDHHQHGAVPAEADEPEIVAQDAGAAAGDERRSTTSTRASA